MKPIKKGRKKPATKGAMFQGEKMKKIQNGQRTQGALDTEKT